MSVKEKGGFDIGDIGVVTRNILQKKIDVKEEPKAPEAKAKHEEPAAVKQAAEPVEAKERQPETREPREAKESKKAKKPAESELVKTSYQLKKTQMDALKNIAAHTNKDYSEVLREIVDFGIEKVEKKNPELLKAIEVKQIFS